MTFEGGEGTGKSTQIARLRQRLHRLGRAVVATREPGGSERAEAIRELLLAGCARKYGPYAEAVLFAAARADHVDSLIRPALADGSVVLCDRFIDSTRVYQGVLGEVDRPSLVRLEAAVLDEVWPELTFVLDAPPAVGLHRAAARRQVLGTSADRFEREGGTYHEQVRRAFLAAARADPRRCRVVDATRTPLEVEAAIWAILEPLLPPERTDHAG